MTNRWAKQDRKNNLNKLLRLLDTYKELTYKQLKDQIKVSDPTLTEYTEILLKKGEIEAFKKPEDRRNTWYRIKPESEKHVKDRLGKYEAIKFVKGISNPAYAYKLDKDGTKAVAVFSTVPATITRQRYEKVIERTVAIMFSAFKIPKAINKQKIAIVVMYDPEGIRGSG